MNKPRFVIFFILFLSILLNISIITCCYGSDPLRAEEELIYVGVKAFQDGFFDIAERQFSLFLKNFPSHGKVHEVLYLMGKIHLKEGRWKEAKTSLSRIAHEDKNFGAMDFTLFWLAQIEIKSGDFDAGRRWLGTLLKSHPRFEWIDYAYYMLGCCDFESKRFSAAENSFKKVSLLSKRGELIRASAFWLAMVSLGMKQEEKAVPYLNSLLDGLKNDPPFYRKEVLLWLGESQLRSGQFQEAKKSLQLFQDQFSADPIAPYIHWRVGFCENRLGSLKESAETFKRFQASFKDHPLSFYTHFILGEIFLNLGDHALSVKELTPLLQTPQPNAFLGPALLISYWNYLQLNEREHSFQAFQRLLKLNMAEEERSLVQWLMAQGLYAEGKIRDALPYYFTLLNSKLRERAMFQIGKGYFLEGQFREALTNLDILLLEFPNLKALDEGLFIKAECLLRLGETVPAMRTLEPILSLPAGNPRRLMALTQIGLSSLHLGEGDKAEDAFRRVLEDRSRHPLFFNAAFQMGNRFAERRDLPAASQSYGLVLNGPVPDLIGPTCFRIGEVLIQEGKEEKALNSFTEALKSLHENSIWFGLTHLEIGNLHRRWGRMKEAEKAYRAAYALSKDSQIKETARESLERLEARSSDDHAK